MTRLQKAAVLTELARLLRQRGSWCGETHMQKAVYLLQDLYRVPTEFDFILYKHGPFSFDLRDELTSLRADRLFTLEPQPVPYGPRLVPTSEAEDLRRSFPKTLGKYSGELTGVADTIGDQGVSDLEKLASALYVTVRELAKKPLAQRAKRLHEIKPHISDADAESAVTQVDTLLEAARRAPCGPVPRRKR